MDWLTSNFAPADFILTFQGMIIYKMLTPYWEDGHKNTGFWFAQFFGGFTTFFFLGAIHHMTNAANPGSDINVISDILWNFGMFGFALSIASGWVIGATILFGENTPLLKAVKLGAICHGIIYTLQMAFFANVFLTAAMHLAPPLIFMLIAMIRAYPRAPEYNDYMMGMCGLFLIGCGLIMQHLQTAGLEEAGRFYFTLPYLALQFVAMLLFFFFCAWKLGEEKRNASPPPEDPV